MWREIGLVGLLVLGGCASAPTVADPRAEDPRFGDPCRNRIIDLRFDEGAETPQSGFLQPLEWAIRAKQNCPSYILIAKGLPNPSQTSLEGRRATNVQILSESFGLRETRFDPGTSQDQARPYLELRAAK